MELYLEKFLENKGLAYAGSSPLAAALKHGKAFHSGGAGWQEDRAVYSLEPDQSSKIKSQLQSLRQDKHDWLDVASLKAFFKKLQTPEIIEFENYKLATFGKRSFNKNYKTQEQNKAQKVKKTHQLQFQYS